MSVEPRFDQHEMTRREALAWLTRATVAGCAACGSCSAWAGDGDEEKEEDGKGDGEAKPSKLRKICNIMELRSGRAKEMDDPPMILVRTRKGLAAFDIACTHKRQDLAVVPDGSAIACPLHNSQFDLEGRPMTGPASRSLKRYFVSVDEDGDVYVDNSRRMKRGEWAPLPEWARSRKKKVK